MAVFASLCVTGLWCCHPGPQGLLSSLCCLDVGVLGPGVRSKLGGNSVPLLLNDLGRVLSWLGRPSAQWACWPVVHSCEIDRSQEAELCHPCSQFKALFNLEESSRCLYWYVCVCAPTFIHSTPSSLGVGRHLWLPLCPQIPVSPVPYLKRVVWLPLRWHFGLEGGTWQYRTVSFSVVDPRL